MKRLLLNYLPMLGTVAMIVSYIPQLYMTYTTGNVEGQSLSFWLLLCFGLLSMVGNQFGMIKYEGAKSKSGLTFQIINTILGSMMIVAILIFR